MKPFLPLGFTLYTATITLPSSINAIAFAAQTDCWGAVLSLVGRPTSCAAKTASSNFGGPTDFLSIRRFGRKGGLFSSSQSSSPASSSPASSPATPQETLFFGDGKEIPADFPRRDDVLQALLAVRTASAVTARLQPLTGPSEISSPNVGKISTVTKKDLSPVTVGDFASQAIILSVLSAAFPTDKFIAEENSKALRQDFSLAEEVFLAVGGGTGDIKTVEDLMRCIDLGQTYDVGGNLKGPDGGGEQIPSTRERVWCLDPIDGTKGFLRGKHDGGQYCIALALLEDGIPTIGVLGCPNLPAKVGDDQFAWSEYESDDTNWNTRGCIFVASKGGGCFQLPILPTNNNDSDCERPLAVTANDSSVMTTSEARFCLGVEKFTDPLGQCGATAKIIHGPNALNNDGDIVKAQRMDSQCKYGVIARGGAEFFLRLPKSGYVEWIWDSAPGSVVLEEAGGRLTDIDGNQIDFSLGAKLSDKVRGIAGSNGGQFHKQLIEAFKEQERNRK